MTNAATSGPSAAADASLINRLISQWRSQPLIPLLVVGAVVLAVIAMLLLWAREPEYRVLYSNLSEADGGRIVSELEKRAIPYRIGQGGQTLMVPSEQMHVLRLQLAEQGLPQGGNVGFELMDKQAFGISQFSEQLNFQRGLEGELARTIESLGPVARARVHLAMAKQSVFVRERQPASASVVLNLQSGRELGEGQVSAIAHLVSSSVPGLPVEAVTVVDQSGRLLSRASSDGLNLDGQQLTYIDEVERSYQRRIENILAPILGAQNIRAQVVAQIDFASREQTAERYGPNQGPGEAAIRSQSLSMDQSGANERGLGVPGALTNSPPNPPAPAATGDAAGNAQTAGATESSGSMRRDNMINYEVDRNVEHVQQGRGNIQRLSAAVVVNYRDVMKDDELVREPLSDEELAQINRLVRQAMGFSESRGDQLEVINSTFAAPEEQPELDWWKTPEFYNLASSLSRFLLVAFIALLLWLIVLRPLKRRHDETQAAIRAQAEAAQLAAQELAERQRPRDSTPEELAAAQQRNPRRKSSLYEQNLQSLRDMTVEDPRLVAMIIHNWMNKND